MHTDRLHHLLSEFDTRQPVRRGVLMTPETGDTVCMECIHIGKEKDSYYVTCNATGNNIRNNVTGEITLENRSLCRTEVSVEQKTMMAIAIILLELNNKNTNQIYLFATQNHSSVELLICCQNSELDRRNHAKTN